MQEGTLCEYFYTYTYYTYIYIFILYVLDMHLISIARENGIFLRRLASLLWGSAWNPIIIRLVMELGPFIINTVSQPTLL